MSAADPGKLFDLRCAVREAMIAYLREACPNALLRERLEVAAAAPWPRPAGGADRTGRPQ
jgi:hypothetical protein